MSKFFEAYQELEDNLRRQYDNMVESGEMTEDEASFAFFLSRDDILMSMPEDM